MQEQEREFYRDTIDGEARVTVVFIGRGVTRYNPETHQDYYDALVPSSESYLSIDVNRGWVTDLYREQRERITEEEARALVDSFGGYLFQRLDSGWLPSFTV